MSYKIAFIGFGNVGQGLAEILIEKTNSLRELVGKEIQVVAIVDLMKGSIYDPQGLDLSKVMQTLGDTGRVDTYPPTNTSVTGWDSFKTIRESNADAIIEVTYTDVKTGQPGIDHCRVAIQSGKHVITTNKGPLAIAYKELASLAKQHQVQLGFEGTVMSGTPAIRLPIATLAGNDIQQIRGIFNGTTNYMLTQMEAGFTYEEALKEAQALGYAEADPTSDVEGYDALYKVLILANVVMGESLRKEDVECQGITQLTPEDIAGAKEEQKRWKLLATITRESGGIKATVQPEKVDIKDPLAGVSGATNAITYECDLAGPITLVGAGAGRKPTGFSLLIDLINIIQSENK